MQVNNKAILVPSLSSEISTLMRFTSEVLFFANNNSEVHRINVNKISEVDPISVLTNTDIFLTHCVLVDS